MARSALGRWLGTFGLRETKAKEYGIEELTAAQTERLCGVEAASYGFRYFDRGGKDLGILKVRLKVAVETKDGRELRYMQTRPGVFIYLPRGHGVNWAALAADPAVPLVVTEGEKKAHALCSIGAPTVALGGVTMWRKDAGAKELHPDLDALAAAGRKVVIVFDSDSDKKEVAQQRALLKRALEDAGCVVALATPPHKEDGSKNGVDDYLFPGGKVNVGKARKLFDELVANAVNPEAKALRERNAEWTLITNGGAPYVLTPEGRCGLTLFDSRYRAMKLPLADCMGKVAPTRLTEWWRVQPGCSKYEREVFHTSKAPVPANCLNLYAPPVAPAGYRRPDMAVVEDAFAFFLPNEAERSVVLSWVGYAVTEGERKLWATFVRGPQGTGKTFLGNLLGACFAPYVKRIQIGDLVRETFGNKHYERVRFLQADEGGDDGDTARRLTRLLKHQITSPELEVEEKYVPSYKIDNRALIYLSSNHRSVHVEPSDRRFYVVTCETKMPGRLSAALNRWLRDSDHPSAPVAPRASWALWEYFSAYRRAAGFDELKEAPPSNAKAEMVDLGRSGLERRVHELMTDGSWFDDTLGKQGELVTAQHLANCAGESALRGLGIRDGGQAIGGALSDAGCLQRVVRVNKKATRVWAVRNIDAWRIRPPEAWAAALARPITVTGVSPSLSLYTTTWGREKTKAT